MKANLTRLLCIFLLSLTGGLASNAYAQASTMRYPEYQPVWERETVCRDVVVERGYSPAGAVVGAVVGYAIGREIDRGSGGYYYNRGHYHGRNYRDPYYGRYYRDSYRGGGRYYRDDSRVGRIGGTVGGAVIGGQIGRGGHTVQRVCEQGDNFTRYREELVGYRVVTTYSDGTVREHFEPVRRGR